MKNTIKYVGIFSKSGKINSTCWWTSFSNCMGNVSTPFIGASGLIPRTRTLGRGSGKVEEEENGCEAMESNFYLGWVGVAANSDSVPRMVSPTWVFCNSATFFYPTSFSVCLAASISWIQTIVLSGSSRERGRRLGKILWRCLLSILPTLRGGQSDSIWHLLDINC